MTLFDRFLTAKLLK